VRNGSPVGYSELPRWPPPKITRAGWRLIEPGQETYALQAFQPYRADWGTSTREPTKWSASRFQGASLTTMSPPSTIVPLPVKGLQTGGVVEPSVMLGLTVSAAVAPPSTIVVIIVSLAAGSPG
jgi:hypothetical protein